jgi:hypothetical protein
MKNGGRYASLILGAGALLFLAEHGIPTLVNPFKNGSDGAPIEYLVEDTVDRTTWENLVSRKDVIVCLVWFFVTSGVTTTLPSDFNTLSNSINIIGNGAPGGGGSGGSAGSSCGGGGGGCGGGC